MCFVCICVLCLCVFLIMFSYSLLLYFDFSRHLPSKVRMFWVIFVIRVPSKPSIVFRLKNHSTVSLAIPVGHLWCPISSNLVNRVPKQNQGSGWDSPYNNIRMYPTFTGFLRCSIDSLPAIVAIWEVRPLKPRLVPHVKIPGMWKRRRRHKGQFTLAIFAAIFAAFLLLFLLRSKARFHPCKLSPRNRQ